MNTGVQSRKQPCDVYKEGDGSSPSPVTYDRRGDDESNKERRDNVCADVASSCGTVTHGKLKHESIEHDKDNHLSPSPVRGRRGDDGPNGGRGDNVGAGVAFCNPHGVLLPKISLGDCCNNCSSTESMHANNDQGKGVETHGDHDEASSPSPVLDTEKVPSPDIWIVDIPEEGHAGNPIQETQAPGFNICGSTTRVKQGPCFGQLRSSFADKCCRDRIFEYVVDKKPIGRGSSGTIFRANTVGPDQQCTRFVVKQIANKVFKKKEVNNMSRLCNQQIVEFFGILHYKSCCRILMEEVKGCTLFEWKMIKKERGLKESLDLFREILLAVSYMNGEGIIHGDIHDGNVMVINEGKIKLLDFGCSEQWTKKKKDVIDATECLMRCLKLEEKDLRQPSEEVPKVVIDLIERGKRGEPAADLLKHEAFKQIDPDPVLTETDVQNEIEKDKRSPNLLERKKWTTIGQKEPTLTL